METTLKGLLHVYVSGLDLLDGTPVLDIKPYIRKYDSFQGASAGWLDEVPSDDDAGSSIPGPPVTIAAAMHYRVNFDSRQAVLPGAG
eukprot:1180988-Prorocentrum_minimum.AAC.10